MKFTVLSLFPEILRSYFESSIMAKAVAKGLVKFDLVDIRNFAEGKHRSCDDAPYSGGAGQLMLPEPLGRALDSVGAFKKRVVYVTPGGKPFTQRVAQELSAEEELVIICGRYEGIDQRVIDLYVDDEISIGDFVMSSGEVAALAVIDSVYRLVDGVISSESLEDESFSAGLLEYPQYTRPQVWRSLEVPEVLRKGNHAQIKKWKLRERVKKTLANRPDLLAVRMAAGTLSSEERAAIDGITGRGSLKRPRKKKKAK